MEEEHYFRTRQGKKVRLIKVQVTQAPEAYYAVDAKGHLLDAVARKVDGTPLPASRQIIN